MTRPLVELEQTSFDLAGQHRLLVTEVDDGHSVQIVTAQGATPIVIEVTSQGITLRIDGPGIALRASGALSLSAEKLTLEGRKGVVIASGGDLDVGVAGDLTSRARAHTVRAEAGSVDVNASDDVKLVGERVMVNCDETVERHFRDVGVRDVSAIDPAGSLGPTLPSPSQDKWTATAADNKHSKLALADHE